jgi:hypothetical protein
MALQVAHDSSHSSQVLIICGLIIATVMFYGHSGVQELSYMLR